MKSYTLAIRIWFLTNITFGFEWFIYTYIANSIPSWSVLPLTLLSFIVSLPALIILIISLPRINNTIITQQQKILNLALVCLSICLLYGLFTDIISEFSLREDSLKIAFTITGGLFASSLIALTFSSKYLSSFFIESFPLTLKNNKNMEPTTDLQTDPYPTKQKSSNKILYKGIITGVLILVMLIPTFFISNLVQERQERQAQVANEVSDKWAQAQTLTGPYIYLPYKIITIDKDKKVSEQLDHLIIIPDNLTVNGQVSHELRLRSIYKVLLYRATLSNSGNFQFQIPKEIDSSMIQWQNAKICYGISDFKGLEERLIINFKGSNYELSPGLPTDEINEKGLSSPIPLSLADANQKISFNINLKIKGSEQLHFVPLSGDSRFTLSSTWANPSFDGNNLPSVRTINNDGFTAMWMFNKANLPFGTVLNDFKYDENSLAFGVTMVQPADGYAKTNRCIKYALLFIGLTFSLFFIVELMQKKAMHPVQYILIGLALVIFYTLLLSISEFIPFDYSYFIAAVATILLITLYSYGHFKSSKTASIFGSVLTLLYGFTFVLIRLEDTALLLGSIGLFIILAIAMYFSRKINWYGEEASPITI